MVEIEKPYMKVKKLKKNATLPSKRSEDAGYDLYAVIEEENLILMPGEIKLMPTGISIQIPQDYVFYIAERGSTGSKGIAKRAGIIDSGFRGEIFVALNNTSNKPVIFYKDETKLDEFLKQKNMIVQNVTLYPLNKAIAQGLLLYCPHVEIEEVTELGESIRGSGALGSSKK